MSKNSRYYGTQAGEQVLPTVESEGRAHPGEGDAFRGRPASPRFLRVVTFRAATVGIQVAFRLLKMLNPHTELFGNKLLCIKPNFNLSQ